MPSRFGLSCAVTLAAVMLLVPAISVAAPAGPESPGGAQEEDADRMAAPTFRALKARGIGPSIMSGRIADIAIHPDKRSTWYVAIGSGGVFKTVNSGTTWDPVFDDQGSYSIGCVTIDPTNPEIVWVGTGENVSGRHVGYGDGVYKSTDGGASWTNMGLSSSEHIGRILVDPRDSNVVLVAAEGPLWTAGGERGVFRTTDGGDTWEQTLEINVDTGVTDLEYDPSDPDVMYAAAYQRRRKVWALLAGGPDSGIYKSTDGGKTWRELTRGLPSGDMGKINLAVSPLRTDVVYATIEAGDDDRGFYRSTDRGESWTKRSSYTSGGTGPHYYQEIYASPHVFDRVYQMDVWIQVTDDGGSTFGGLGEPDKHSDNHALAFVPDDPDYLLAGSDGGLYETFDRGASWKFVANLPVTQIYKMAVDNAEPFYNIIGGTQDNGTIYGPSRTASVHGIQNRDWIVPYGADGYSTAIDPEDPDILYLTWQNGHLLRYDRRTRETLDIQPQPAPGDEPERWNWDAPLQISPHDSATLYYGSQRLWRSDDRGDSWRPISGDLSRGQNRYELEMADAVPGISALYDNGAMSWYGNSTSVSESPLVEGLVYVGTDDGLIQVTEDGGDTWRRVDSLGDVPGGAFVNEIKASLNDPDTVFAALDNHKQGDYSPYLVKSTDRGNTWVSIVGDIPDRHLIWSIVEDHVDPNLLFVGTELGLRFTTDGGGQWIRLSGGVPEIPFRDIEIQRSEGDLVAASFARGFYVLDDYAPLRNMSAETLDAEALLFPVRGAWRYVESEDLGMRGKGYLGSAHWNAPNPSFGAVFTYWLRDENESARDVREESETELREGGEDVPFAGWDALADELAEREPEILITIADDSGDVVRRLKVPYEKGLHRVAWDLRYPSPDPIELGPESASIWGPPPAGPLVVPGTYAATLSRLHGGEARALGEPQSFEVRDLPGATGGAGEENLAFQQRTADAQRQAYSIAEVIQQERTRLRHMREAALQTPRADVVLVGRAEELLGRLDDLWTTLSGNSVRRSLREPSAPPILGRIGQVSGGHWWTTEPPTQTFRDSLAIAEEQLEALRTELVDELSAVRALEEELEAAGAPWTPGRPIGG